jgi:hypothetical protein
MNTSRGKFFSGTVAFHTYHAVSVRYKQAEIPARVVITCQVERALRRGRPR